MENQKRSFVKGKRTKRNYNKKKIVIVDDNTHTLTPTPTSSSDSTPTPTSSSDSIKIIKSGNTWADKLKSPPKKQLPVNKEFKNTNEVIKKENNKDNGFDIKLGSKYILWSHDISERNWSIDSYKKICTIETVSEFWRLFNNFIKLGMKFMHFFLMKDGINPTWEDPCNRNGGVCSFKVETTNAPIMWEDLNIKMVLEILSKNKGDINGLSISPKNTWTIVKIWNKNSINDLSKSLNDDILEKYRKYSIKYRPNAPEY
jgi:hypothetical protein